MIQLFVQTKHRTSVGFERRKSKQSDGASMNGALLNANGSEVWSNGPNLRALNIRRETLGNHVFHYGLFLVVKYSYSFVYQILYMYCTIL